MNPVNGRLTHRCTIERRETDDTDHRVIPTWEAHLEDQPCFYYNARGYERVTPTAIVPAQQPRAMFAAGVDVKPDDRINGIADRAGGVIRAGLLNVRSVLFKHTHIECDLEAVG